MIPRSLREEAGVPEGSLLKVDVVRNGEFLVTAQLTVDHSVLTPGHLNRKQVLRELAAAVDALRQDSQKKGLDKMPLREINRAVAAARRDLKKKSKHPTK